jgi:hypothetical protein
VREGRSKQRIVHSALDVKSWCARLPGVDEVRPGQCPCCGVASRPVGDGLTLHGHGLRARQVRGPLSSDGTPVLVEIVTRRYQCQACGAVLVVVPRGVLRYRYFSGSAIAWALALLGVERRPPPEVRRRTSPGRRVGATAASGWAALWHWIAAVRGGRLWPGLLRQPSPPSVTRRRVAERAALALAGRAPPPWDASPAARAFIGAAQAA